MRRANCGASSDLFHSGGAGSAAAATTAYPIQRYQRDSGEIVSVRLFTLLAKANIAPGAQQLSGFTSSASGSHGAEPTIYGAALLKRAAIVFDELRESVKDIEFLADPTAGEVRIGCHPVLAPTFITAVIDRLSQRYPRIVFRLVATQAEILYRELNERNVDLLVAQRLGPLADEKLGSKLFMMMHMLLLRARAKSVGTTAQDQAGPSS